MSAKAHSLFDSSIVVPALADSFKKLNPAVMIKNPVMFVTMVGALVTTAEIFVSSEPKSFTIQITVWLWFTVLFANFAERWPRAVARRRRMHCVPPARRRRRSCSAPTARSELVDAASLRKGDVIVIKAGEMIAGDGEIIEGAATVDESAITGESAPVIREAGGDRSAVTGGTRVLSMNHQGPHLGESRRRASSIA
jgi:K+-transporting ATPase ATPase B chain